MRVDIRPRKRNAPKIAEKSAPGKIEAMHLDFAGGKGMGTKVADRFALPCCSYHHRAQHDMGWKSFMLMAKVRADMLLDAAERLWRAWPGRIAWERKLEEGR
jgi:hypothetical protein